MEWERAQREEHDVTLVNDPEPEPEEPIEKEPVLEKEPEREEVPA
jgi:hypothetical protein